jgi:ureidoacrylate peracid hydrolase
MAATPRDFDLADRDYPRTFAEKVDPRHTVVLVVDMQNEFCAPDGYVAKQGWDIGPMIAMAERLRRFLDAARPHVRVVHARGQYEPPFMPAQMVERLQRLGIPPYCQPGTRGVEFYPGFEPQPGEHVITKRTFSAFAHTELDFLLRNLGVRTVVVTGTFTNVCVDSTARDAYFRDYYVVIPDDLTANPDGEAQRAALKTLGHFFGVVVPSSDLLAAWQRQ